MATRHRSDPSAPVARSLFTPDPYSSGALVGGYRLVRVLGTGSRSAVYLGIADDPDPEALPRTAAVKIFHDGTPLDAVDREIAALTRVSGPHLLDLLDLATLPGGRPCLVVERLGPTSAAQLVAERAEIEAGEAVTLVAPVGLALDELHRGGVVHSKLRAANVLLRESGAPVVVGFGAAELMQPGLPPAVLSQHDAVLADRQHLLTLATIVLERVPGMPARELLDAVVADGVDLDGFGARLSDRLFDLAEPRPVRLAGDHASPTRRSRPTPRLSAEPSAARVGESRPSQTVMARSVGTTLTGRLPSPEALLARVRGAVREVRPRFWGVAGAVAVCLVVAVAVVPRGGAERRPSDAAAESEPPAAATPGGVVPESPAQSQRSEGDASPSAALPAGDDPVLGDDPLAALPALLDERARCLRDLSVLCLDGVLQAGSGALEKDTSLIRALQGGGEVSPDAAIVTNAPVLVERLGDSALVDLGDVPQTQPASTLMMRGEAGWRIRDYVGG